MGFIILTVILVPNKPHGDLLCVPLSQDAYNTCTEFYKHDLVLNILFILSTPELYSLLSTLGSLLYNYNFVFKIGLS